MPDLEVNTPSDETPSATKPDISEAAPMAHIRVVLPAMMQSFSIPNGDGATLVVTRAGRSVPVTEADAIIETAAKSGVTIRKDNAE